MYKRFLCKVTQIKKVNLEFNFMGHLQPKSISYKVIFCQILQSTLDPINVSRLTFLGCATVGPPVYQPLYLSAGAYRPAALRRSPSTGNTGKI